MGKAPNENDKTGGQPRRSADSRHRPGTDIPEAEPKGDGAPSPSKKASPKGERKPSESWSAIDPGRPTKGD